jgi:hypothetical protein
MIEFCAGPDGRAVLQDPDAIAALLPEKQWALLK